MATTTFRIKRPWAWNPGALRPEFQSLATGLKLLLPLWDAGGCVNLIDRTAFVQQSGVAWNSGPVGLSPERTAGTNDHFYALTYQSIDSASDHTVWGIANPPASSASGTPAPNHGSLFYQRRESPYVQFGLNFNQNGAGDVNAGGYISWISHDPVNSQFFSIEYANGCDGNWHSYGFRRAGNGVSLWMDGNSVGTTTMSGSSTTSAQNTSIGGLGNTGVYGIACQIGLVAAWQRALSDNEMALLETNWLGLIERAPIRVPRVTGLTTFSMPFRRPIRAQQHLLVR